MDTKVFKLKKRRSRTGAPRNTRHKKIVVGKRENEPSCAPRELSLKWGAVLQKAGAAAFTWETDDGCE